MTLIFLSGSLRNPRVPLLANDLREIGYEVFDDWHSAGPRADDHWQEYETARGHSYKDALQGWAAQNTFAFDLRHLKRADISVLLLPSGKSSHMEFGYVVGRGKAGFILFEDGEPARWDVLYQFARGVFFDRDKFLLHMGRTRDV